MHFTYIQQENIHKIHTNINEKDQNNAKTVKNRVPEMCDT